MPSSFRIYIDESGDEGFSFKPNAGGSSEWFVLSAIVVRAANDGCLVQCMQDSRVMLKRLPKTPLHFCKLTHGQRLAWVQAISKLPIRMVSILVHKPLISDPEVFKTTPYHLYRYCSRLLMERISWFCRESNDPNKGDGTSDIYFSNRRRMSYVDIQDYWQKLKDQNDPKSVRIDWNHIDPKRIAAVNHDQLAGLQIADCVASAHWQATSLDRFGNNEARYFSELRRNLYRHGGTPIGYGLKFWPDFKTVRPSMTHLAAFDGL